MPTLMQDSFALAFALAKPLEEKRLVEKLTGGIALATFPKIR